MILSETQVDYGSEEQSDPNSAMISLKFKVPLNEKGKKLKLANVN